MATSEELTPRARGIAANIGVICSWLLSDKEARLRFIAWYRNNQRNPAKAAEINEESVLDQVERIVRIMGRAMEQG